MFVFVVVVVHVVVFMSVLGQSIGVPQFQLNMREYCAAIRALIDGMACS